MAIGDAPRIGGSAASDGGGGSTPDERIASPRGVRRIAGDEHQHAEQHHERHRRRDVVLDRLEPACSRRPTGAGTCRTAAMKMPRPRPPTSARGRLTSRPTAAAAMATTTRLKKSPARERVEPRRDEHAGQPGEEARQRPAERRHPVGVDAVELGHPRALDHRPHAQADRREPEEQRRARPWPSTRDDHRHQLVAAERVDAEGVVEDVGAAGHDALGRLPGHGSKSTTMSKSAGSATVSPRATTSLATGEARAQVAEDQPLEHQPEQRREHEHRQDERRDDRPAPLGVGLEEHAADTYAWAPKARLKTPDVL